MDVIDIDEFEEKWDNMTGYIVHPKNGPIGIP